MQKNRVISLKITEVTGYFLFLFHPYIRKPRLNSATLFGYIEGKSRKIVKMMNFEQLRVAKSFEKYIVFDKNCSLVRNQFTKLAKWTICMYVLSVTQNHYKECVVAPSGNIFWGKIHVYLYT